MILNYAYVCGFLCGYVDMNAVPGEARGDGPPGTVSHPMWVLGNELGPFAKAVDDLNL